MAEARRNTLVGMFMLVGLLMLAWLLMMFGEMPSWLSAGEYPIEIRLGEIYGIAEATPVDLNGVPVGRVRTVEFVSPDRPGRIKVIAYIKREFSIPVGTVARVQPSGLGLGLGNITLVPPESFRSVLPKDGDAGVLPGQMVSPFGDIISVTLLDSVERAFEEVGSLAAALVPAAEALQGLLDERHTADVDGSPPGSGGLAANLSTVIERVDQAVKNLDILLSDPVFRDDVMASLANIREMTADTKRAAADIRSVAQTLKTDVPLMATRVTSVVDDLHSTMDRMEARIMPALDDAASAAALFKRVARDAAEGDGTVGLLLRDPRLYEAMVLGVQRITDLIDTLRRMAKVWEAQDNRIRIDYRGPIL